MKYSSEVSKFVKRTILFALPFAAVVLFPVLVLTSTGELSNIDKLMQAQRATEEQMLIGLAYSNPDKYYKLQMYKSTNPEIGILGSSRVMQLRSEFFKEPSRVYNAGGAVKRILDYRTFLEQLPSEKIPRVLILGIDQYYFNENFDKVSGNTYSQKISFEKKNNLVEVLKFSWMKIYVDFVHKKFTLNHIQKGLYDKTRKGLSALANNNGFRRDGSYYYGKTIKDPVSSDDAQFKQTLASIRIGSGRFVYGSEVSERAEVELRELLNFCKQRNIYVSAFLPPYANEVFSAMQKSGKYGYLEKLPVAVKPVFQQFGYTLFDFSDIRSVGSSDLEAIDGFHGSEKTYARLLLIMAEQDSALKSVVSVAELAKKVRGASSNFEVISE